MNIQSRFEASVQIHAALRDGFRSGKTKDIAFRKAQLSQLVYMIEDNKERFQNAIAQDSGKPAFEASL